MTRSLYEPTAPISTDAAWIVERLKQPGRPLPTRNDTKFCRHLKETNFADLQEIVAVLRIRPDGSAAVPALYLLWIELTAGRSPELYAVWYNLGAEYSANGQSEKSLHAFEKARTLKNDLYQASVNIGLIQESYGQTEIALENWRRALQPDEARTTLLNHLGRLLEVLKRYDEAERQLFTSLLTNPHQPDVIHHWIGLRTRMCIWPVYGNGVPGLEHKDLIEATHGMASLSLFDDPAFLDQSCAAWVAAKNPAAPVRLAPSEGYAHDKIRIGYLSSDYCMHPISYLVAELFELHDRSRFEVYGYCSTKDDGSAVRQRVLGAFDKTVSVLGMSDEQAARAIRADEIDILIDLNGMTMGSRLQVMRWRPAPVQLTYLGYMGTLPLPELDYILCDDFLIPRDAAATHRPKPLYMPGCYQVNDSKLPIAARETRKDAGLPEDAFVFCCFSNNYKITEAVFAAWMQILQRADRAVLWMLADNKWARDNMAARAAACGIAADRLIFATRVDPDRYRARLALADLFLDTYPYNAGTTASDALRVGLPIVTLCGKTVSSRMAGSLMRTVGLQDGIVDTAEAYIELAVELATNKARYEAFVRPIAGGDAWARTLGDTAQFTLELEGLYATIAKRPE